MPTIQIETEQLLNAALQLPPPELERFVSKLHILGRAAQVPCASEQEAQLLRRINQAFPKQLQQRCETLRRKRRRAKLTRAEQQELLALIKQMEQFDVERLQQLADLARLRGLALPELMQQLGLQPPAPEYD